MDGSAKVGSVRIPNAMTIDNSMTAKVNNQAKRLVILGLLLQGLHILFGVTAIMGMFINHMLIDKSRNTLYHSHLRWQLITFWLCAVLYLMAFLAWRHTGALWPAVIVLVYTFYRIGVSAYFYRKDEPIKRIT